MIFKAFMSYSHTSGAKTAAALQQALHRFAKPWYRMRALRVFRDQTNLSASPGLWPSIQEALGESEFFLLVASPEAAQSHWVRQEIDWWLANRQTARLLIIIVGGDVLWDDSLVDFSWPTTTALPDNLRGKFASEPLYVDLRWAKKDEDLSLRNSRFRQAVLDIATPLRGVAKDELDGEDVRQYRRTRRIAWNAGAILFALTVTSLIAGGLALQQRRLAIAQRNDAVSRELAANSVAALDTDPSLSLALAVEAVNHSPTAESYDSLRWALVESRGRVVVGGAPPNTRSVYYTVSRYSPDGRLVATGSLGHGQVRLWEAASGKTVATVDGHMDPIESVDFSPDGTLLASVDADGTVRVWRIPGGQKIAELKNAGHVTRAAFSPGGKFILTTGEDDSARLWDPMTGRLGVLNSRPATSTSAAVDSTGTLVVTADSDHIARLWNVGTGLIIAKLSGHTDTVHMVAFSPDGKLVASASADKTVRLWATRTGRSLRVLTGHKAAVFQVVFNRAGNLVATASGDGTAKVWNVKTGEKVLDLPAHPLGVDAVAFDPSGKFLATAGRDNMARVWEVETGLAVAVMRGHADSVTSVAFSPDGRSILTDSFDRSARTWQAIPGAPLMQFPAQTSTITDIAISRDRKLVGTAGADGTTQVWQTPGGTLLTVLHGRAGKTNRVEFGPDSTSVLTAGDDGTVRIFDAKAGTLQSELRGHPGSPRLLQTSRDRKLVLTAREDGTASAWDWTTGKLVSTMTASGALSNMSLSQSGRHAMTVTDGNSVQVWNTATGSRVSTFKPGFMETVLDGAFVNGGPTAVVVGRLGIAGSVEFFDAKSGKSALSPGTCCYEGLIDVAFGEAARRMALVGVGEVTVMDLLEGRTTPLRNSGVVASAAFSPNEECMLTIPPDGRIRLWEAKSGRQMTEFSTRVGSSSLAAFSDDSQMVVVSTSDTAQIFATDACATLDAMIRVARSRIVRPLNPEERRRFLHADAGPAQR